MTFPWQELYKKKVINKKDAYKLTFIWVFYKKKTLEKTH
jgi:hypothetical protein